MTRTKGNENPLLVTIAAIASLGLPFAALAQTADSEPSIAELRELGAIETQRLTAIEDEVIVNGPLSPELYELHFALATHYSERGDDVLAAEALEQALYIQRVNHGLFSMEQVAAIRSLIEASLASGGIERATELDIQLMRIARQNLDDIRSAAILGEAANRQMGIYQRYLAGELPPVIDINIDYGNTLQHSPDPNRLLGMSNLFRARRNWFDAINVLVAAGQETDPRVVEYETRLIESYFTEAGSDDFYSVRRREGLFRLGKASYQRILTYAAKTDDIDVAGMAMIGLADWHLLFQKNGTALDLYANAYDALLQLGVEEDDLEEVFNPEIPVVLPAFKPNPLTRAAPGKEGRAATDSYLTVKLVMSRYGRSRLRNLSITPEPAQESIEDRLRRIVARSRFRPMLIDGEAQPTAEFEFRYYVADTGAR